MNLFLAFDIFYTTFSMEDTMFPTRCSFRRKDALMIPLAITPATYQMK